LSRQEAKRVSGSDKWWVVVWSWDGWWWWKMGQ